MTASSIFSASDCMKHCTNCLLVPALPLQRDAWRVRVAALLIAPADARRRSGHGACPHAFVERLDVARSLAVEEAAAALCDQVLAQGGRGAASCASAIASAS